MTELESLTKLLKWNAGREKVGLLDPKSPRPELPFTIGVRTGNESGMESWERRINDEVNMRPYTNMRCKIQNRVYLRLD